MIQKFISTNKTSILLKKILIFSAFLAITTLSFAQNDTQEKKQKQNNKIGNFSYIDNISNSVVQKKISLPQDVFKLKKEWWIDLLFILGFSIFSFFILKFQTEISHITNAFIQKSIFKEIFNTKSSIYNNLFFFFNFSTLILLSLLIFSFFKNIHSPFKTSSQFLQIIYIFVSVIVF